MSAFSYRGIVLPAGAVLQSTTSQPIYKDGERVGDLVTLKVEVPIGRTEPQTAFGEILERLERIERVLLNPVVWEYKAGDSAALAAVKEMAKAFPASEHVFVPMTPMIMREDRDLAVARGDFVPVGGPALTERARILSLLSDMADASESATVKATLKLAQNRIEETP